MAGKSWVTAAVVAFVIASSTNVTVSAQDDQVIGQYERLRMEGDLTERDVRQDADGLKVVAPPLASAVKVERSFLDEQLGDWSSSAPFAVDDAGRIVIDDNEAIFRPLKIAETPVFTLGSADSVRFVERPMWVSVSLGEDSVKLELDDGKTDGQRIEIAETWLNFYGIATPRFTHEDGTVLEAVADNTNGAGSVYRLDVPHFSFVIIDGITWNVDDATGAIWRELTAAEYAVSPWNPLHGAVYVTRNPGSMSAFQTQSTATLNVALNAHVRTLSFNFNRTLTFPTVQVWGRPASSSGTSPADIQATANVRTYAGDIAAGEAHWVAARGRGFVATGMDAGKPMEIVKNGPGYALSNIPPDAVFALAVCGGPFDECEEGGNPPPPPTPECRDGVDNDGDALTDFPADPGCGSQNDNDEFNPPPDPEPVPKRIYLSGEFDWCGSHQDNWDTAMGEGFQRMADAFAPTRVQPVYSGAICWFRTDGSLTSPHGPEYVHRHPDGSTHSYSYNWPDHSCSMYMSRVLNVDWPHTQGHFADSFPVTPDNYQAEHAESCIDESGDGQGGQADLPGVKSVATPNARPYATSHELGHNFNAVHSEADCLADGTVTLMHEPPPKSSCGTGNEVRVNVFSTDNRNRINENVG